MGRILVLGGTGFVGRAVCEQLARRSSSSRTVVPTRQLPRGNTIRLLPTVDLVEADVHDSSTLQRLLQGCDAVINLVAILHGSEAAFQRVHVELPRQLVNACHGAGVRRLVHVSALGVGPDAPSLYLRSKTAGEAVLSTSGLDVTVLRPSVIFGAQDRFLNLFARLQSVAPLMPLAGSQAPFQPVWVDDVAAAVVQALDTPAAIGQTFECTGPGVYTLSELVRLAGRWAGHERMQIALPGWAGWLQAAAMELLPGEPLMSRDNLQSMQVPNVATPGMPGLAALGITAAALEAVAPTYLGDLFQRPDLDRFRATRS
ncbi:MAG: complex I NDUFA9 subunit family protein [Rubrivivax sp.]|nr:complex I NDUFA9 subunit family protein [Rubrivivax sp.]MDP3221574.1 complex I NDUFA9 subunit family protein [Rubrivivax sp.]MDP3611173.1 complex I NDUFA9 subunit family protein [Rubrivivax sp.]